MQGSTAHAYPSIAESFSRLVDQWNWLTRVVPFVSSEQRLLVLIVARTGTICVRDVQNAVQALEHTSEHYDKVRRLLHYRGAYRHFSALVKAGVLVRIRRGRRTWYRLHPSARRAFVPLFDEIRSRG